MKLSNLTKVTAKRLKRVGQGEGSGRGKKSGRGGRGQNSRNSMPLSFEGGALTIIKRLPFMRGKGKNKSFGNQPFAVNVGSLSLFKKDSVVDLKSLIEAKIVDSEYARKYGIKILSNGEVSVSLIVKLPASKNAIKKIEKAGGKVEV
jgi:large subunit ribosomal protein L15